MSNGAIWESLHLPPGDIAVKEEMDHTTQMRINFADAFGITDAEAINVFEKELAWVFHLFKIYITFEKLNFYFISSFSKFWTFLV